MLKQCDIFCIAFLPLFFNNVFVVFSLDNRKRSRRR